MKTMKNIIAVVMTMVIIATMAIGTFMYVNGFGISFKDGLYKEMDDQYRHGVTYRYGNLTLDDVSKVWNIDDHIDMLFAGYYHPSMSWECF